MEGDTLHGPEEVQTSGIRRAEPSGPQTHRETDWDRSGAPGSVQDHPRHGFRCDGSCATECRRAAGYGRGRLRTRPSPASPELDGSRLHHPPGSWYRSPVVLSVARLVVAFKRSFEEAASRGRGRYAGISRIEIAEGMKVSGQNRNRTDSLTSKRSSPFSVPARLSACPSNPGFICGSCTDGRR